MRRGVGIEPPRHPQARSEWQFLHREPPVAREVVISEGSLCSS
jgi:hypothetical protein